MIHKTKLLHLGLTLAVLAWSLLACNDTVSTQAMAPVRYLWVQDYEERVYTRAGADALVEMTRGKFTDLLVAVRADDDNRVWFRSSLTRTRDERIEDLMPGEYLVQRAHAAGMRVHAWFYVGFWGTYSEMHEPPDPAWNMRNLSNTDCNAIDWVNFAIPEMRQKIADHVADIVTSNDLDGAHLDYLRLKQENFDCRLVTADHVTDTAQRIRDAIGTDKMLTATFSGRGADMARQQRRDIPEWLTRKGLFDSLQMLSFLTQTPEERLAYLQTLPNNEKALPGLATTDGIDTFRSHFEWWTARGFESLTVFDSYRLTQEMADYLPAIETTPIGQP